MQSQNERLLDHLIAKGKIDPLEAWVELGIYRLGARIFDLRQTGINITSANKKVTNRFGETCRVACYELV
jgi:hypothetical protein